MVSFSVAFLLKRPRKVPKTRHPKHVPMKVSGVWQGLSVQSMHVVDRSCQKGSGL